MARARRNWTLEEDARLRRVVNNALTQSRPLLWRELAKSVPGRSNKDCRRRWWNSLADGTAKGSWSEEEDERLIEAVRSHGTNWSQVAPAVGSRNPDQCSSHWSQVLDPDINYCDWTTEEDEHLLHAVLTHSTNWATIAASHAPKRTTLALKNRYSTLRLRHENGKRSKEHTARKKLRASLSNLDGVMATSQKEMRTRQKVRGYLSNRADEVAEEDDEEDGEDDEDEDGDEDDDDDDGKISRVHSDKANTGTIDSHTEDSNTTTSGALPGITERSGLFSTGSFPQGTSPVSTENWTNDTADLAAYESPFPLSHPSLYLGPGEDLFGGIQDSGEMSMGAPYITYGEGAMNTILPPSADYPTLTKSAPAPSASSNVVGTETSPSEASSDMSTRPMAQAHPSTTYQISITMACTGAQLETVMVNLISVGTGVTMKIDPKS
ncbi:hypothetical protein MMC22_005838 [Lobaria immixta]|nr:hypothetical protein [Lobaria immixta]